VRSPEFWEFYDTLRAALEHRAHTFARVFEYLDRLDRPVGIIETGCVRAVGNWRGDGGSTVLFDKYAQTHPGSVVQSVDIDAKATELCRSLVSSRVTVHTADSVRFLETAADAVQPDSQVLDLLYLDSFDLDKANPLPSALHHLMELTASTPLIRPETMVVVDDSFLTVQGIAGPNGQFQLVAEPTIDGKGKLIAEYARRVGAELVFQGYQCGWIRMRGPR